VTSEVRLVDRKYDLTTGYVRTPGGVGRFVEYISHTGNVVV
jgi:hypothetical protein